MNSELGGGQEKQSYEDPPFEGLDQDLLRAVLADHDYDSGDKDRIYFLTTTPLVKWIDTGEFRSLPESFHESLTVAGHRFRPASEAYVRDNAVFEKGTDRQAWMVWVTVKERAAAHLMVVEVGVWCCQLGGGASTEVWQKVDGVWRRTKTLDSWVS